MKELTPKQIVSELDKYVIGQDEAKKSVAIAMRNRWRRQQVEGYLREEIIPNNIVLIGPTGVGKTEIARRLANLASAPFIKVEASKFTEVGYVGRDVESMVRDLTDISVTIVKRERKKEVREQALTLANERLLDLLVPPPKHETVAVPDGEDEREERRRKTREHFRMLLERGDLEDRPVELDVKDETQPFMQVFSPMGLEEMGLNMQDLFGGVMPKKRKRRRTTVEEARKLLEEEEAQKLIDMDKVIKESLRRVMESGIVFIDEIDKIVGETMGSGPDVSREGVQRDLLPVIEGSNVVTKYGIVDTTHILFIASGAFHVAKPSDMIPELQGRFPIRVELDSLTSDDFIRILTEPRNSLIKQYTAMLGTEGVKISFDKEAITEIARLAGEVNDRMENIGARRLHTVMSKLLEETLFELPEGGKKNIKVTKKMVRAKLAGIVEDEDLSKYIL